jgi:hypothetical protein
MTSPSFTSNPTYADFLKRTSKSYAYGGSISQPTEAPAADEGNISIFKSFSVNAFVADFKGHAITKSDVIELLSKSFDNIESVVFLQQGRAAEVAFATVEATVEAINKGLMLNNCQIPLSRSFSMSQDILGITVKGVPSYPKEETYEELKNIFSSYGELQQVKFHYYGNTTIRMPTLAVILDITNNKEGENTLPRQVLCFGKQVDLFWRRAPPYCSYCKNEGHYVKLCPTLARKNANRNKPAQPVSHSVNAIKTDDPKSLMTFQPTPPRNKKRRLVNTRFKTHSDEEKQDYRKKTPSLSTFASNHNTSEFEFTVPIDYSTNKYASLFFNEGELDPSEETPEPCNKPHLAFPTQSVCPPHDDFDDGMLDEVHIVNCLDSDH